MEMKAAVFRKVNEPLTVESVEIDEPWGREVLVRTAATGVCHSDLHVVDGLGRWSLDRPITASPLSRRYILPMPTPESTTSAAWWRSSSAST